MADNSDLENGIILDENGNIERIRTDRERYDGKTKYSTDSEITLEEMFDHIKMHYRKDTNCISLSSNANVSINYGRGSYKDKYVLVTVPKREIGEKAFNAGQYMLTKIERRIDKAIQDMKQHKEDLPEDEKERIEQIKQDLEIIDRAETSEEIKEIIKVRYKSKELDINKTGIIYNSGSTLRAPHSRIREYKALNEEQNLEKNKIIAKLTILEQRRIIEPIIKNTADNRSIIQTIGSAFSSSEIIYYGDIDGERLTAISPEIVDIFALLQQAENENQEIVSKIKREILEFALSGQKIEVPENSILKRESKVRDDISIDEVYEITGGTVEYGETTSIVKNLFYLAKSQTKAKEFVKIIREITNNNPEYEEILNYIENNGFEIEPAIITRHIGRGYRLSEAVGLDIKNNELIEQIKELTEEEQIEIVESGGLSNVQDIMTNNFAKVQKLQKIDKEEYYAEAIISLYDWEKIGIQEFTLAEKNNFVQRLKEEHCFDLYKKLEKSGINRNDIPRILLNIVRRKNDFDIEEEDTEETIKQKRLEQYDRLIENIDELNDELSIEAVERFLGYYDIEDSKMQLRLYQQEAVEKVDEIFENKRYASVILPTGGGKSYVALDELLKHKEEKMLYLAPTNEILEQMKDIIVTYHGKIGTFGKSKDEIVSEVFPNLKFMKYPSLLFKEGREAIKEKYDFIVLDELHRTGAEKWGKRIDKLLKSQSEGTRVLGITATPRRDSDGINMANEIAEKLGYTNEEAVRGNHISMNLSLVNAIRMGIVVNPKLISCEYNLKESGDLDRLEERIRSISDINEQNEKLEEYEKLRRSIEHAKGVSEILQENIKPGGKYIVFLPVVEDIIEDEDGNKIGRKKGQSKIEDYKKQIAEYFEGSGIVPQFNSMLGEYGDDKNRKQLEEFQNSSDTRFMLVMNKANEGLHIEELNGIIWLRPLDENSRILYLQQLGRVIYAENPDRPTKDENRPVVIDLVNNTMNVHWEDEITEKDDIQMMNFILDWTEAHDEVLPDINSKDKEESGYAKILKEIQGKYSKYLSGEFGDLSDEQIEEIKTILELGKEFDLWGIDLPDKEKREREQESKNSGSTYIDDFKLTGLLSDFVKLEREIEERTAIERFIITIEQLTEIGVDCSKMVERDTIETLAKKSKISRKQIEEIGLNPDEPIGVRKNCIATVYRGTSCGIKPTDEQVAKLLKLKISLELKENAIDVFIRTIEQLTNIGVDCSKIVRTDTIETLAKKQGISRKQIEEAGLDSDENIGIKKRAIARNI